MFDGRAVLDAGRVDSLVHLDLAPPKTWEQFEELCADTFAAMWNDPGLVRHGRSGQRQNGVDIVSRPGGRWTGLQCKKKAVWPVKTLTKAEITKEVAEALTFTPKLEAFWMLTTAPDDIHCKSTSASLTKSMRPQSCSRCTCSDGARSSRTRCFIHSLLPNTSVSKSRTIASRCSPSGAQWTRRWKPAIRSSTFGARN